MNLSTQRGDFELRNRFGSSLESPTTQTEVSSAGYVWQSLKSIKRKFTFEAYDYEKKRTLRQNARYAVAYLGTFLVLVTVLAVYMIWRSSAVEVSSGVSDFAEVNYDELHNHGIHLHHKLFGGHGHKHLADALKATQGKVHWHKQMAELRPDDAINPSFNHMAISVMLTNLPDEDALLQTSITTFLRQINYLQISSAQSAHAFVGGAHNSFISFAPESNFFPALERYVDGFKTMLNFAPNQDWFIQIDEDTYLFLENIKVYLGRYDPASALFFHNFDLVRPDPKHIQHNNVPKLEAHFPVGIMSRAALQLLASSNYAQCFMQNKYVHSEETVFDICLKELGINSIQEPLFHPTEPSHDFAWPVDSCKRPLSISRLSTQQLQYLYRAKPHSGVLADGSAYKWDSIVTYSDVFQQTFPKSISTTGIDRHSASKSKSVPASSGYECQKSCVADPECISWTFERPDCYTSPTIGISISRPDVVSGLVNNRYQCLAPVI